ncbi:MAG: prohead protease/major capsid protein fusion protein, partial [Pseudomonadota bacterium]
TTSTAADGTRTKRPTAWAVAEISLTPEPADPNARVRSTNGPDATAQSGSLSSNSADDGGHDMPKDTIDEAEITRRKTIRTLCRAAGMGSDFADDLIDSDATETEAKAAIHDAAQTRRAPVIRTAMPQNDDPAVIMQRQSDALAYRMGGGDLTDESRPYAEQSLFDMARDAVQRSGASVRGISRDEILHRAAHGTSDFPLIVSNAAGKTAQAAYQAAESPLKQLCRKQTLRDFKTSTAIKLGEFGELVELPESGEFQATSAGETGESMALKTFGRRVDLSRNLIINDDLGLFGSTVAAIGQAAAQTEATQLVALITDNPTMSDGTAVFDASRGNVAGTAGVPSTTTLSAAREAMRKRTGTDGEMLIDAAPKFLLVDPSLETTAEEILATIQPNTTDAVNVFAGKLTLLVEPRLPEGFWYLFSDPSRLASMRYAYLSGAEGVQIQRREAWDTLGVSFRAYLDWGAGWLDWRGAHRVAES